MKAATSKSATSTHNNGKAAANKSAAVVKPKKNKMKSSPITSTSHKAKAKKGTASKIKKTAKKTTKAVPHTTVKKSVNAVMNIAGKKSKVTARTQARPASRRTQLKNTAKAGKAGKPLSARMLLKKFPKIYKSVEGEPTIDRVFTKFQNQFLSVLSHNGGVAEAHAFMEKFKWHKGKVVAVGSTLIGKKMVAMEKNRKNGTLSVIFRITDKRLLKEYNPDKALVGAK